MEAYLSLQWLLIPLFVIPLLFLTVKRRRSTDPPLNLPPTPPGLPLIGNLHQLGELPHATFHKLSKKYGPVMLLQLGKLPTVVVSSPETAMEVMKTHDLACCSRPDSYGSRKISYNLSDIAFGPYTDYWREMRKLCVIELFTVKRVKSFSKVREEETSRIIDSIMESCNTPVNLTEKVYDLTNAFICRVAYGINSHDAKQFEVQDIMEESMAMLSSFWTSDFFPTVGKIWDTLMGKFKRLDECFKRLDTFFETVIEAHLVEGRRKSDHEDIVDSLLRLSNDPTATFHLTRDHIKALLMDVFIGAVDTSALITGWVMSELARNPRVMKKVQSEIREAVSGKTMVEETDIEKLKYLKMVLKESLRLHPPGTLLLPRETMRHCKIGGYDIPAKTRILVSAWGIGRDPTAWKDPEEFFPERFEHSSVDFKGTNFELIPFGAGRRICPGLMMGVTAQEYILANLLYRFDWELPPGTKIDDINMEEAGTLTVHRKYPLYLIPVKAN